MASMRQQGWKVKPVRHAGDERSLPGPALPLFIARKGNQRLAVHCRAEQGTADDNDVLAVFNLTALYEHDLVMMVSAHGYTSMAHQLSRAVGVRLLSLPDIHRLDHWLSSGLSQSRR
jgi:hypothetical protein